MQIVIDIPEELYEANIRGLEADEVWDLRVAVKNGTPLPKGHGKLIDVNDLLYRIGLEDNASNREDNVGEIITLEDFDFTPAIIEADEESEEE